MRRAGALRKAAAGTNGAGQGLGLVLAACSEAAGMAERTVWETATRLDGSRFAVQVWLSTAPALDELAAALAGRGLEIERMPEVDSPWECGALRCRMHLVPHGVDIPDPEDEWPAARAERKRLGAGPARPLWLCPARLEPARGQAILLESLAELSHRGLPFTAAFVGEGSQREALERQALEAGLSDAVRVLGQVDDLGPLLLAADAVALPLLDERAPATLLEALGRARPLVASRTRGICQIVEDGINGRLVPPGDPGALAAALESFHRAPDAACRLGENGELLVREEFTWARVVAAYESVYDEVLGLATFTPLRAGRG